MRPILFAVLYYHVTDVTLNQGYCHIITRFVCLLILFVLFVYTYGE